MNLKSCLLVGLLCFFRFLCAQQLIQYHIGMSKDSIELDSTKWQIVSDSKGLTAFQFNGEDTCFMQIALSFDKDGRLYNINLKTKPGKNVVRNAYKIVFDGFKGGKTDIIGACMEGSLKKFLWVNENSKLDYKESCYGQIQATINWMKIR